MRQAVLDPVRQKATLAAVETAGQTLEFDVAEKLVGAEGNNSLGEQALLRPHLASRVGALPFPSVPPVCPGSLKIAGPELNRPWKPAGTVHPRINADEQAHLQVHAKQQRGLFPTRVEIELVTTIGAVSVSDLETVPVGGPSSSSVPARL